MIGFYAGRKWKDLSGDEKVVSTEVYREKQTHSDFDLKAFNKAYHNKMSRIRFHTKQIVKLRNKS